MKRLTQIADFGLEEWERIDICDSCYHMLLNAVKDKEG